MRRTSSSIAIVLFTLGCSASTVSLPVPDEATGVDARSFEVEFVVNRPYPYDGVHDFYGNLLGSGWRRCPQQGLTDWSVSKIGEDVVQEKASNWVNRDSLSRLSVHSEYLGHGGTFTGHETQRITVRREVLAPESVWETWVQMWCEAEAEASN